MAKEKVASTPLGKDSPPSALITMLKMMMIKKMANILIMMINRLKTVMWCVISCGSVRL